MITDAQVQHALDCLQDWNAAKARAAHEYLDDYTKTLLAELADEQNEVKSQAAAEAWARKQPKFRDHLEAKRKAAEHDYMHRQRISASLAVLDLYRTQCANERGQGKL
jgi:hypothetical protein